METVAQLLSPVRLRSAATGATTTPCTAGRFSISAALSRSGAMNQQSRSPFQAVLAGLFVTAAQVVIAVLLLAPEGPIAYRYSTLVQHDAYWFANIVDRGYGTIVPPINHKMMEVSNVAFFPAYPAIAGALHNWFGVGTYNALLITAQTAAFGFWSYFFLFCDRWNISPALQVSGALVIAAHPAAFFLVAAYSESLFMMALFGFIYWSTGDGRIAKILAAVHGILMSATRIVGIACAAFPVVAALLKNGWSGLRGVQSWSRRYGSAIVGMLVAMLGAVVFFLYCLVRWGRWDIYMLTQQAGWGIVPDYLAVLKPASYRWLVPDLNDPTSASQLTMTLGAVLLGLVAIVELLPAIRRRTAWSTRIGIYFCAAVIYYISVSGVACVEMESMLRYEFCVHALIVLALLHFLHQFRTPPVLVRAFGMAAVALFCAAGLSVQGWYVWNFTRGGWVA